MKERINFDSILIYKDTLEPIITIYSPLEGEKFASTPPNYNLSIIEVNLISTWYIIEGVSGEFDFTELNGSIDQDAWDAIPEGEIIITYYAQDRARNMVSESVVVIKGKILQQQAPAIPGYNLSFIIGTVFIILILRKKK